MIKIPDGVQRIALDSLIPYVNNARKHSDEQVAQIAASIKEFGFNNPVLLDDGNGVIAGHGRVLAAKKLGMDEVPVVYLSHLTDAQRRAYILADNRIAENSEWDMDLVKAELDFLQDSDVDIGLTGFDLDDVLGDSDDVEIDDIEAPEPPEDPVTQKGDLWTLGEHKLMCGDSTVVTDVDRLMGGGKGGFAFY